MESIAIRVHEGTVLSFDLSPDGRTIVFDLLGQLWQLPATGGDARPLTDAVRDTAEDRDPSFSPDGNRIVFRGERAGRTGLWLLEPGGAPRQLTQLANPDGYDGNAAWSPDGTGIMFVRLVLPDSASPPPRPRMRAMWLDLATRETRELRVPDTVGPALRDPAWAPNGRGFAVVAAMPGAAVGGRLWLVEPDSGGGRATPLTPESSRARAPAFATDGRRLAFFAPDSAERTQVWVLRLDTTGAAPMKVSDHADVTPTRVRWTADGRRLVYSADGRLWSVSAAGGPPTEIAFTASLSFDRPRRELPPARFPEPGKAQPARAFMGLALAPDGRRVAMIALGKLWVMPVGGSARAVADLPLSARHLTWAPDGSVVWWAGRFGEENLFATDVGTGNSRQLTALPGRESAPVFAPNGRLLAFLHQPNEDTTLIRVIDPRSTMTDGGQGRAIATESGADFAWTPASDGLLIITGGWSPGSPTKGTIVRFAGERANVARMPDSPLSFKWVGKSIIYIRHARLWRARFDSTGIIGEAESLGAEPAMYASVAKDGTVLYISEGGLRLRAPNGKEQRLGWPVSFTPPVPAPLLIRNARVIDGTGRPAGVPQDLLVEHGRIASIAPAGGGAVTAGTADTLDAGGRFIIPGMMDLHAHEYRPSLLAGFAYFGITTIRDQGSHIAPLVAYADAIAAGKLNGPRVAFGGFQFYTDWAYDAEDQQGVEPEADPDHAARAVEMARIFGSQHIKTRTFRRWDINARLITEAHRRGMRATGHCAHLLPLAAAGIDAKEHAGFCDRSDGLIYDDFVQLYRAAGIGVVPTIVYSSFAVQLNERPDLLAADRELAPFLPERSSFNWMLRLNPTRRRMFADFARSARSGTAKLVRAGVVVGTGTDIWQIPTGVHMELEELVAAGLSPLEAIRAATGDAARIIGVEQDLGTIAVGKWADLVILDADPVADIRNSRRIWAVLQSGRVLDRAALVAGIRNRE